MRIGILGAARIAPLALINPAKENVEVVVAAVAARAEQLARPVLPPALGPNRRSQTCGAFLAPRVLRIPARRFAAAVLRGEPVKMTPEDAVQNMTVIDAIYRAAGLPFREPAERT
jgi:predicted dehydrogenase